MRLLSLLFLVLLAPHLAAQSTLESIPNQKLINGSYVSNPDRILQEGTVTQIDTLLGSLEKQTSVQVAVVVVQSIGNEDIFEFAQKLFTAWGIGNKDKDNGLLLLLVKDRHTVRFHTGYGLEGVLPDVICKRIQRDYMVPEFKNENYNAGVLAGLQQVKRILVEPAYAAELKAAESDSLSGSGWFVIIFSIVFALVVFIAFIVKTVDGGFADSKEPKDTPYPEMRMKRWPWLLEFVGIPALIIFVFGFILTENPVIGCLLSLYCYFMITLVHRLLRMQKVIQRFRQVQNYREIVDFIEQEWLYWLIMSILFPLPYLLYFFYHGSQKEYYRNHPRKCKECGGVMGKLNEATEDQYLSKEQQMEESLQSVDYEVWKCDACQAIETLVYRNRDSTYKPCPTCKTMAYGFVSSRTLKAATYSSSGSAEAVYTCKFCGFKKKSNFTLAQLIRSAPSSSSSLGSSSSSSSGGSSSGGGSWGGGSSGGGGSSSSW